MHATMEGTAVFFVVCFEADATLEVFSLGSVPRLYIPVSIESRGENQLSLQRRDSEGVVTQL
jgi:hypothetical protein